MRLLPVVAGPRAGWVLIPDGLLVASTGLLYSVMLCSVTEVVTSFRVQGSCPHQWVVRYRTTGGRSSRQHGTWLDQHLGADFQYRDLPVAAS